MRIQVLAPSNRPVQVTENRSVFWRETYPKLKQQLLYYNRVGCTYSERIMAKGGKRREIQADARRCGRCG